MRGSNREIGIYRMLRNSYIKAAFFLSDIVPCDECRKPMTREQATVDHIIPVVAGGISHNSNFRAVCAPCNNRKGSRQTLGRLTRVGRWA